MQIFVDADACPVVDIVETIAEKYNISTTLLCDTNHILYSDYSEVIVVYIPFSECTLHGHLEQVFRQLSAFFPVC